MAPLTFKSWAKTLKKQSSDKEDISNDAKTCSADSEIYFNT